MRPLDPGTAAARLPLFRYLDVLDYTAPTADKARLASAIFQEN
jgi:hypothetical protein